MLRAFTITLVIGLALGAIFLAGQCAALSVNQQTGSNNLPTVNAQYISDDSDGHQNTTGNQTVLPVTTGTTYQSFIGPDFRPLDNSGIRTSYANGSGGGIFMHDNNPTGQDYLEAGLDLPDGVLITEITFYYRDCYNVVGPNPIDFYFGSYTPNGGNFLYHITAKSELSGDNCASTQDIRLSLTPPVSINNSQRRYVLGANPHIAFATSDPTQVQQTIFGARIGYRFPSAYIPYMAR